MSAAISRVRVSRDDALTELIMSDDYFEHARKDMIPKMRDSALTLTIYSGTVDPKLCLELGAAILLDKPIIVALKRGVAAPANLKRCATRIVEVDYDAMNAETQAKITAAIDDVLGKDKRPR